MSKAASVSKVKQYVIVLLAVLSTCTEPPEETRIILENDASVLASRVVYLSEEVLIDTSIQDTLGLSKASANPMSLTLIAEVDPPVVNGQVLQATDVYVRTANRVYVSYNMVGEPYLGAVDLFSVTDIDDPELVSSMHFTDSDVNGLTYFNNNLYLAMATNRDGFDSPAVVERVGVSGTSLTSTTETYDVPSWAATDVAVSDKHLFVTSGADGGHVTVFKLNDHSVQFSYPVEDARAVDVDDEDVAVLAGTPAKFLLFDYEDATLLQEYSLSGANIPFSKSTVELYQNKAILALGDGGTQVICLASGEVIGKIDPPVVDGLDSTLTVANAATASSKDIFISNGEAGVYVAWSKDKLADKNNCQLDDLQMIGSFRFDDMQSVNHVKRSGNYLYIAGGLGGLKILKVKWK